MSKTTETKKKAKKATTTPPTTTKSLKSPGRLLSPKERGWTNELESAIANDDTIELREITRNLSDFELATHAIVAKDHAELALHRIRRLQL